MVAGTRIYVNSHTDKNATICIEFTTSKHKTILKYKITAL